MRAYLAGLVVYDSVLFRYGGKIHRWAISLERRFTRNAREQAPMNKRANKSHWYPAHSYPGALKAGITGDVVKVGPKQFQTTITSDAPYTLYVLRGTSTPITPTTQPYMTLPRNPGFGSNQRARSVRGQSANNFLQRAASLTAVRHASIRGFAHTISASGSEVTI